MRDFGWALIAAVALLSHLVLPSRATDNIHHELFHFDDKLGWHPTADKEMWVNGTRRFFVKSNRAGFRDLDHAPSDKPPILFLGDSYTWGFDVSQHELFTEKLRPMLPQYEIWNQGVTAYGTDQEWLLLRQNFSAVKPKIVVLVYCSENDRLDNRSTRHGPYHKPVFFPAGKHLALKNVPVPHFDTLDDFPRPKSDPTHAILKQMDMFLRERGTRFVVALTAPDESLTHFLEERGIDTLVLSSVERQVGQGNHWSPAGHTDVAERIARYLILTIS